MESGNGGAVVEATRDRQDGELLSLDEAAQFLGTSTTTLYRLLKQNDLSGLKVGRQWRFRKSDLLTHLSRSAGATAYLPAEELDAEIAFFRVDQPQAGRAADDTEDAETKVKRLACGILRFAIEEGACDVHLRPVRQSGDEHLLVTLRFVNGVDCALRETRRMPVSLHSPLVRAFKRMAGIELGRTRLPLEGRIFLRHRGQDYDIGVRCLPTTFGEDIAIRLCVKSDTVVTGLDQVELAAREAGQLREWLHRRHGLIVTTGLGQQKPFLYNCLSEAAGPDRRTVILEGHQDCVLPHTASVPVDGAAGVTFADALRAVHNQDPDVIMVETMGSVETARLVHELAFTEYLVLTAVRANNTAQAVRWLLEQQMEPLVVARTLLGIVAQWQARRICQHCKEPVELSASDPVFLRVRQIAANGGYEIPQEATFYQGRGCERCGKQGYLGRVDLFEVMTWNQALTEALLRGATAEDLTQVAVGQGMRTLLADGLSKAVEGKTTLNEVLLAGMATI